jgi:NitT/TauT family transport system substrate-binding protein
MITRQAFLGATAATVALPLSARRAAAQAPVIRVGDIPIDSGSVVFAARDQGFFSKSGVSVEIQDFSNGGAIASALVGGSIDVGGINILTLATAHEKGLPLKIVASGSTYSAKDPTTAMLVPRSSTLHNARELAGKAVAVNVLKGIAHISAQAWIDKNGGDSKAVRFVEMPFAVMPAALTANRVDAAVVAEPNLSQALREDARLLGNSYDGIADLWMIDGWAASESWIAANADATRRFAEAMRMAAIWANRNQDKTAAIVTAAMKLDPAVVRGMRRATFLERPNLATVQPVIDTGARYGALASTFPAADLFAPGALK